MNRRSMLLLLAFVVLQSAAIAQDKTDEATAVSERKQQLAHRDELRQKVSQLFRAGDWATGIECAEEILKLEREVLGESHSDTLETLQFLAQLHEQQDNLPQAKASLQELLRIRESLHPGGHYLLTDAKLAIRLLEQRSQLSEEQRRLVSQATLVNNKLIQHYRRGEYEEATSLGRQALQLREKTLGREHPEYASSLNNLAMLYSVQGLDSSAEPLYRQALDIRETMLGKEHPAYANSLNNLAMLYMGQGDYSSTEPLLKQALQIVEKTLGKEHRDYARSLNNLAKLYRAQEKFAEAEELFQHARQTWEKTLGKEHPHYAASLVNLAELYKAQGDDSAAERLTKQALQIREKTLGKGHPHYADSLRALGSLYHSQGKYSEAEALFKQALPILEKRYGKDSPHYAAILHRSAKLHYAQGNLLEAERESLASVAIYESHLLKSFISMTEGRRIRYQELFRGTLDVLLSIQLALDRPTASAYQHALHWKARVETRMRSEWSAYRELGNREPLNELRQARAQLAASIAAGYENQPREAWLQKVRRLSDVVESRELEMARSFHQQHGEQLPTPPAAETIGERLPIDAVLVDLVQYTNRRPPEKPGELVLKESLLAFVARKGQTTQLVSLGAVQPIVAALTVWREAIDHREGGRVASARKDLARLLWRPLEEHVRGAAIVLIAADGPIHGLAWGALPGDRPGSYLLEQYAFVSVNSAQQAIAAVQDPLPNEAEGLLVVGGVDFGADLSPATLKKFAAGELVAASDRTRGDSYAPLPGSKIEASNIAQSYSRSFGQEALLLTGDQPHEATIKLELQTPPRYLHFATHGQCLPPKERIMQQYIQEAVRRQGRAREDLDVKQVEQRFAAEAWNEYQTLRMLSSHWSGLALAGVEKGELNLGGVARSEDGLLLASEIQDLDLRNTELVVLSACDSGLGAAYPGEGVLGFRRAFHQAGAKTVVASLWKADDAAASVLMEEFYRNLWEKKLSKIEALRQAQLTVWKRPEMVYERRRLLPPGRRPPLAKQEGRLPTGTALPNRPPAPGQKSPPWDWGAFVLSGDWR